MNTPNTTIDRRYVHKRAVSEVLVLDVTEIGDGAWKCTVQIPRGHSSVTGTPDTVPTIAAVEVVRQVGLAVSHLGYGIPLDWAFTIQEVSAVWNGEEPPKFHSHDPFEMEVTLTVTDVTLRKGATSGMSMTVQLGDYGHGTAVHRALAPKDYAVMRRNAPPKGSVPVRTDDTSLVNAERVGDTLTAQLGWNEPGNPFVFDHPVDHIPGMVFATAAIDAHHYLQGSCGRGIKMDCTAFAELDRPVFLTAARDGADVVVSLTQNGNVFASVRSYG